MPNYPEFDGMFMCRTLQIIEFHQFLDFLVLGGLNRDALDRLYFRSGYEDDDLHSEILGFLERCKTSWKRQAGIEAVDTILREVIVAPSPGLIDWLIDAGLRVSESFSHSLLQLALFRPDFRDAGLMLAERLIQAGATLAGETGRDLVKKVLFDSRLDLGECFWNLDLLVDSGARVAKEDGPDLLMHALFERKFPGLADTLIRAGATLGNDRGQALVSRAVAEYDLNAIEFLVNAGALVDERVGRWLAQNCEPLVP